MRSTEFKKLGKLTFITRVKSLILQVKEVLSEFSHYFYRSESGFEGVEIMDVAFSLFQEK